MISHLRETDSTGAITHRSRERTGVADRHHVQVRTAAAAALDLLDKPLPTPLGHELVSADVFRVNLLGLFNEVLYYGASILPRLY